MVDWFVAPRFQCPIIVQECSKYSDLSRTRNDHDPKTLVLIAVKYAESVSFEDVALPKIIG